MYAIAIGVFAAFTGLSVHGAVNVRYFQLTADDMAEFVTACLLILAASTVFITGIVYVAAPYLTEVIGLPRAWLVVGVLVAAAQSLSLIRLSLWQVSGMPFSYGAFQIGRTLSNALLSLLLVLGVNMAWEGRLIGQSAAIGLFGFVAIFYLFRSGFLVRPQNLGKHCSDALRFGIPLIPHVIGGLTIVMLDRFVIAAVVGLAGAGIYMVAAQIGQVLGLLSDAFNKAYSPWLMRQLATPGDTRPRQIVWGTYLYFGGIIALALAIGGAAPLIVGTLAGPAFENAQDVVVYVALGYAFNGCYLIVTNYVFFESRTAILAYITFGAALIHLPLTYILVQYNGIVGAGQAFAISQFLSFLATWWLGHKVHPMPWRLSPKIIDDQGPGK